MKPYFLLGFMYSLNIYLELTQEVITLFSINMAYTICFLATIAVLVFFLTYGLMNISNVRSYFNCDKQLGGKEFGKSFAAATSSLATVLYYFVVLGKVNGLWLLISPATLFAGTYLFNKYMLPRLTQQKFGSIHDGDNTIGNTLGEYIKQRYQSQLVKYVVLAITLLGIISVMLIELYVGVQVFDIFVLEDYHKYALLFIAIVSFVYTGLGGLNAVIKTDSIQFLFMTITAILLVLYFLSETINSINLRVFFPDFFSKNGVLWSNWALYVNTLFVNVLIIPSLLRNWQLFAATKNEKEIKKGLWNGFKLTFVISILFIGFGILFYIDFPNAPESLNGILITMAESNVPFLSIVLFPMLFTACLMALLSTVDSSLLPIVQCLVVDFLPSNEKTKKIITYYSCIFITLVVTIFLYYFVFKTLQFNIISWLFTIFSLVTISSPAILFGCFGNETIIRTKKMKKTVVLFTILGLFIALGLSYWGNRVKNNILIQFNTPAAIVFTSSILYLVYNHIRKKQSIEQ